MYILHVLNNTFNSRKWCFCRTQDLARRAIPGGFAMQTFCESSTKICQLIPIVLFKARFLFRFGISSLPFIFFYSAYRKHIFVHICGNSSADHLVRHHWPILLGESEVRKCSTEYLIDIKEDQIWQMGMVTRLKTEGFGFFPDANKPQE